MKQKTTKLTSIKKRIHRQIRLAVVPHKANQYRPHAVRRYGIALILAIVLISQGVYNGMTSGSVLGAEADMTQSGLLNATNRVRQVEGEGSLALSTQLTKAAQLKVKDMFDQQYWAHTSPDGTTPWHWFGEASYFYTEAGENLAKNFSTSDGVIAAWMQSPTHRANLLKAEYKDVGFAVKEGKLDGRNVSIVVAMYGTPAQTAIQGSSATNASDTSHNLSIIARLGLGMQSLTPAAIGSLILLLLGANVALVAHFYRRKLPTTLRRSWYKHHGAYKAAGFVSLAIVLVFVYGSGGQI